MPPNTPIISPSLPSKKGPKEVWKYFTSMSGRTKILAVISVVVIVTGLVTFALTNTPGTGHKRQGDSSKEKDRSGSENPDGPSKSQQPSGSQDQKKNSEAGAVSTAPGVKPNTSQPSVGGENAPAPVDSSSPTLPPTTPPPASTRPSASNTGVPAGTVLTAYSGSSSNSVSSITYDGVHFTALPPGNYYRFFGNNVTIKNSKFSAGVVFYGDNFRMERSEVIDGFSLSGTATAVVEYCNVHSYTDDGVHITSDTGQVSNVTLANNFIHNPTPASGAHADGLQVRGVNGLTLKNNNFDMGPWHQVGGNDVLNAAIFLEGGNGGNSHITLDGNYLNGAGYTLRINTGINLKFLNNRFGLDEKYGVVLNSSSGGTITQWSGNVRDDDGSAINL